MKRTETRKIMVGNVQIGGQNKEVIQSMCNTKTKNVEDTVNQILELEKAGCEIIRVACLDIEDAKAIKKIKEKIHIPIVADIHYDYRIALEAINSGVDKVRINPGNIGTEERVKAVVDKCKEKNIPIRIGVNAGSLEKDLLEKYGKPTAKAMVESAKRHIDILEKLNFYDYALSLKASNLDLCIEAYEEAAKQFKCPLHLGITESGTEFSGTIKSSIGLGYMLRKGIGDTIRVSLSDDPIKEIKVAKEILKDCNLYSKVPTLVACPTCGRTQIDLIPIAKKVEEFLQTIESDITVAVMGCSVNGPGEAREADIGIAGGVKEGLLFKKGEIIKKVKQEEIVEELEKEMEAPGFWDDVEGSQKKMKELKSLKDDVAVYAGLEEKFEDIETLIEMGEEENDPDLVPEVEEAMTEFEEAFEKIRIKTLLSERYDKNNAIVSLHAGAGGTESCDWCQMLYRMYTRWAADKGFSVEVLDSLDGDEAGIKSITFQVDGENAYGYLKSEHGVHRLVRISPFNAAGKRQTSFVSCDVMPDIEEDIDIEVKDEDIRIDTYRSSGAGGQHINKTSSAIRITHFPTGIVVTCQNERSQHMNKDKAMQMLKAKLYLLKQQENADKAADIRGEVTEIGWGNQIRSYVMQPYTMVKDHRTGVETGNVDAVMDGSIDLFINGYLKWLSLGRPDVKAE